MSSILNVLRSAPTPTRHFTSLQIGSSASAKTAFNPEHHPIVLQQLVQSLTPASASTTAARSAATSTTVAINSAHSTTSAAAGSARAYSSMAAAPEGAAIWSPTRSF